MKKKQVFCLTIATFLFSSVLLLFPGDVSALDTSIKSGDVVTAESGAIYYFGFDKSLHPFPNSAVFHSWHRDFSKVKRVTHRGLSTYKIGHPVCVRPGTWLVKFPSEDDIFAVEPGCRLRPMKSAIELFILYGPGWESRVIHLDDVHHSFYNIQRLSSTGGSDEDGDGIETTREKEYGTSDVKKDTDDDGLSDYEEIFFWSTDPLLANSDNEGDTDGREVMAGQSPVQAGPIGILGGEIYDFPAGSVVLEGERALYYKSTNGNMYTMAQNVFDPGDAFNRYERYFLLRPPYDLSLHERQKGKIGVQNGLFYPTVYKGARLSEM